MLLIPYIIYVDIKVLGNGVSELSITEISQSILISLAIVFLLLTLKKQPDSKGFFILLSGFLAMVLFREADYYFDFIYHGYWKFPVVCLFLITCYFAYKVKGTIIPPLIRYRPTREFTYLFIGILITLIFSRVFGSGRLWHEIIDDESTNLLKNAIQEGLELFGYAMIFLGSIRFHSKLA